MLIYEDHNETSRAIWLYVKNGRVCMEMQDLGEACGMMNGRDEYERAIDCSLADLENALGLHGKKAVLGYLAGIFNTYDSIDRFMGFLAGKHIKCDYFSY